MRMWSGRKQVVWWMTFTSAPDSPRPLLRNHFEVWRRRLAKLLQVERTAVEYVVVDTHEGHGVLHAVVAFPPGVGKWLDFGELGDWWLEIHGARQVKFKRVGGADSDVRRLSSYLIAQYMASQGETVDLLGRISCSRAGLPLGRLRRTWWRLWVDKVAAYRSMNCDTGPDWAARWRAIRRTQVGNFRTTWDWLLDAGYSFGPDWDRWALMPDWRGGVTVERV
jgi:hypothetical protein